VFFDIIISSFPFVAAKVLQINELQNYLGIKYIIYRKKAWDKIVIKDKKVA
jgi:hypothetical protein